MNLNDLEFHEIANTFPLISEEETQQLADDIKKQNRLIEPIVLYEEKILDGRNRFKACKLAGYRLQPNDVILFEDE
jgi:ParB-like chromosome segregation protein Spo0J